MVKALPITYNGTQFRSRLEADWALTLDTLNVPWRYEVEGFELSNGLCYSPDFYLPSARAWLEVKGSHMLGVSKVEQFAADLWRESGATTNHEPQAPMVLLGLDPEPPDPLLAPHERLRLQAVKGIGYGYSVAIATCRACDRGTVIAFWQPTCRGCGTQFEDGYEAWSDSVMDIWLAGSFRRVVRPAGGKRP